MEKPALTPHWAPLNAARPAIQQTADYTSGQNKKKFLDFLGQAEKAGYDTIVGFYIGVGCTPQRETYRPMPSSKNQKSINLSMCPK